MPGGTRFQSSFAGNAKLIPEVPWPVTCQPKWGWFSKGVPLKCPYFLRNYSAKKLISGDVMSTKMNGAIWMFYYMLFFWNSETKLWISFRWRQQKSNSFNMPMFDLHNIFLPGTIYGIYIHTTSNYIYDMIYIYIYRYRYTSNIYPWHIHVLSTSPQSPVEAQVWQALRS